MVCKNQKNISFVLWILFFFYYNWKLGRNTKIWLHLLLQLSSLFYLVFYFINISQNVQFNFIMQFIFYLNSCFLIFKLHILLIFFINLEPSHFPQKSKEKKNQIWRYTRLLPSIKRRKLFRDMTKFYTKNLILSCLNIIIHSNIIGKNKSKS